MTNYERLFGLPKDALAWFLMLNSKNCNMCVYKKCINKTYGYECDRDRNDSCISGCLKWLDAELSELDDKMFKLAVNNDIVTKWNELPYKHKDGQRLKYVDGYAVAIEDIQESEGTQMPF